MPCTPIYLNPYRENGILSYIEHIRQFSEFYQEILSGSLKYRASPGNPIHYGGNRIKGRSNTKIGEITTINYEGVNYDLLISAGAVHIKTGEIMAPVCSAPAKLTKTKKTSFLKAVVRTFLDDPENVTRYIPGPSPGANQAGVQNRKPATVQALPEPEKTPAGYIPYLRVTITEEMVQA